MNKQMLLAAGMTYAEVCQQFQTLWPRLVIELFFDNDDFRHGTYWDALLGTADVLHAAPTDAVITLTGETSCHRLRGPILATFGLEASVGWREGNSDLPYDITLDEADAEADKKHNAT